MNILSAKTRAKAWPPLIHHFYNWKFQRGPPVSFTRQWESCVRIEAIIPIICVSEVTCVSIESTILWDRDNRILHAKGISELVPLLWKERIFEKEVGNEETCGAGGDNYLATREIRYSEFALGAVC